MHSKGLYKVALALENKPNATVEETKWHNRLDEAYGFLCLSISPDLLFYLDGLTTPNQVWTQLESLFGVQDELRAHQLEIDLFSLIPSNFESLEGFFTKFKSLLLMLKQCGIEKKINYIFSLFQNWVLDTQFLGQLSMILGLIFRIGKFLL